MKHRPPMTQQVHTAWLYRGRGHSHGSHQAGNTSNVGVRQLMNTWRKPDYPAMETGWNLVT